MYCKKCYVYKELIKRLDYTLYKDWIVSSSTDYNSKTKGSEFFIRISYDYYETFLFQIKFIQLQFCLMTLAFCIFEASSSQAVISLP